MSLKSKTTSVQGSLWVSAAATSNVLAIGLNPSAVAGSLGVFGTKLANIADCFALFRFTKLAFELPPLQLVTSASYALLGYEPEITTVAPSSATQLVDLPWVAPPVLTSNGTIGVPNVKATVPAKVLKATGVQWFRTQPASYDDNLEYQGTLYYYTGSGATDNVKIMVRYTIEFKDFVGTAQTPLSRADLALLQNARARDGGNASESKAPGDRAEPRRGMSLPVADRSDDVLSEFGDLEEGLNGPRVRQRSLATARGLKPPR